MLGDLRKTLNYRELELLSGSKYREGKKQFELLSYEKKNIFKIIIYFIKIGNIKTI